MIAKLFRRLTADPDAGAALFEWATRTARRRDWYEEGSISDTIDGRFAVLSAVVALCCLRLEELGEGGERLSIALTERFAQVMESEHRELGIGDPTLGKTVLKLVGSLGRQIDALRPAMMERGQWAEAAAAAFRAFAVDGESARWLAGRLEQLAARLRCADVAELRRGDIA